MKQQNFFDAHMQVFNLSHTNLSAFFSWVNVEGLLSAKSLLGAITGPLIKLFTKEKIRKINNLISFMDNDIGSMFLLLEHELRNSEFYINGKLTIGGKQYDKLVLIPLLIDFGYKGKDEIRNIKYNSPPIKPIRSQVNDMFSGINFYLKHNVEEVFGSDHSLKISNMKDPFEFNKLFEIYPFMGINPDLYSKESFRALMDKYFNKYSNDYPVFKQKMGTFPGDVFKIGSNSFLGIKLYPPLGLDTTHFSENMEYLLDLCVKKNIPIITHASDSGFLVDKAFRKFSDPQNWDEILSTDKYRSLKICFAHFGNQSQKGAFFKRKYDWRNKIIEYAINPDRNVYTDISCIADNDKFYRNLTELTDIVPGLSEKILFGSDFSINLLWNDSYSQYYRRFVQNTELLHPQLINQWGSENPERFLFTPK